MVLLMMVSSDGLRKLSPERHSARRPVWAHLAPCGLQRCCLDMNSWTCPQVTETVTSPKNKCFEYCLYKSNTSVVC